MLTSRSRCCSLAGLGLVAILAFCFGCGSDQLKYESRTRHCRVFNTDNTYVSSDTYIGGLVPYGDVWNDGPNGKSRRTGVDEINASPLAFKNGNRLG